MSNILSTSYGSFDEPIFDENVRPVMFESDDEEFPYWGKGSSFLIANESNIYWVTASHVLENSGGETNQLRVFPSDKSCISLPFNEKYTINREPYGDDEEYKDVFMLRIDQAEFDRFGDTPLVAQDITLGVLPAECLTQDCDLFIIGYPSERNEIDYDCNKIKRTRVILRATYRGKGLSDHCHELNFNSSITLTDYDGLSGSPIFYMQQKRLGNQIEVRPLLVGMLLRGTVTSGIGHFVSSRVITHMIDLSEDANLDVNDAALRIRVSRGKHCREELKALFPSKSTEEFDLVEKRAEQLIADAIKGLQENHLESDELSKSFCMEAREKFPEFGESIVSLYLSWSGNNYLASTGNNGRTFSDQLISDNKYDAEAVFMYRQASLSNSDVQPNQAGGVRSTLIDLFPPSDKVEQGHANVLKKVEELFQYCLSTLDARRNQQRKIYEEKLSAIKAANPGFSEESYLAAMNNAMHCLR